ncbi:MAG TPA: FAD-dependent oxidoreductase [Syntrophomonas sp.]|nr:FAD-dependent oxidoreductase [Syntrophomonas sp.]
MMKFPTLLSPVRIGSMEVKNRFVVPPMGTNYATEQGVPTQQFIDYYTARAKGGFGLIVVEVTAVSPIARAIWNEPGLWCDEQIEGWRKLAESCHKYGAKIVPQLHHAGRQTNTDIAGPGAPVAPTSIMDPLLERFGIGEMPRALTTEEVWEIIGQFRDAAVRAQEAGLDGVEIHGAHGYLVAEFMSAYSNKRIDEFGGCFEGRMKFPVEIVKAIKKACGNGFNVIFRYSADERIYGGRTIEESKVVARILEEAGVHALHLSNSVYGSYEWLWATQATPAGYIAHQSEQIKKSVKIPCIVVGRLNNAYLMEDILATGQADLVALGRESLAEPEWPNKVAGDDLEDIAPCISCHQGCAAYIFDKEIRKCSCLVNPFCGKEETMKIVETKKPKKVMIVGGGPGGLEAAWVAAKRGHHVTLYEKQNILGGAFRIAAIPSAKTDLTSPIKYYINQGRKFGVEYRLNTEVTPELIAKAKPDVVILATGGVQSVPKISGIDNPKFLKANDVLEGKAIPGHKVLVVGGGLIGAETADFMAEHSRSVSIIEMQPDIALDMHDVHRIELLRRLKEFEVDFITDATVVEFLDDGVVYKKDGRKEKIAGFDSIVLAMGTVAYNPLEAKIKGKVPELYVIGDAASARQAIDAIAEAAEVACSI